MIFTNEEKEKMVKHIESIIDYIRENVQPIMRDYISIHFKGTYNTSLTIYKNKIVYSQAYGKDKRFCKAEERTKEDNRFLDSTITEDQTAMFDVISKWQVIKQTIQSTIQEEKELADTINNFTL